VCACDTELVRSEFYLQYPTHGDEDQRKAARQKAFKRKLDAAQEADLIGVRMVGGAQLIWLAKPEATSPNL
jgi:hypothetical protein